MGIQSDTSGPPKPAGDVFLRADFFAQSYAKHDQEFLTKFLAEHPKIAAKFDEYKKLPAAQRLEKANADLDNEKRTGLIGISIGKKPVQTVAGHVQEMHVVAKILGLGNDPKIREMIDLHDICEAITGDIPNQPDGGCTGICREDKMRIEMLAAKLLFEAFPEKHAIFLEYEARETQASRLVKGIDALELTKYLLDREQQTPIIQHDTDQFWHTSETSIHDLNGCLPHALHALLKQYKQQHDDSINLYL